MNMNEKNIKYHLSISMIRKKNHLDVVSLCFLFNNIR
jgi:hypothetical protein